VISSEIRLLGAFENVVTGLDERIRCHEQESQTLAATRDLLLPKLMSGKSA
jgi:hypothetical protein